MGLRSTDDTTVGVEPCDDLIEPTTQAFRQDCNLVRAATLEPEHDPAPHVAVRKPVRR